MAFPNYTTADTLDGTLSITLLSRQVGEDATITTPFVGVTRSGSSFSLVFSGVPSTPEQTQCDTLVAAHRDLSEIQDQQVNAIKSHRDGQRLAFDVRAEYPAASGNMFSCSASSQDNWSKLATLDSQGSVTYPYTVTTYDERGSYDLIDTADREAATLAIATVVLTERGVAESYIAAVLATTDSDAARAAALPYLES